MPTILEIDPEVQSIERVIEENAKDYGENSWEILNKEENDGILFVKVRWGSEKETLGYFQPYKHISERDKDLLLEAIENYPFRIEENPSGNWTIKRDKEYK